MASLTGETVNKIGIHAALRPRRGAVSKSLTNTGVAMRTCFSLTEAQCKLIPRLSQEPETGCEIRLDTFSRKPDFARLRRAARTPLLATYRTEPHYGTASLESRRGRGWDWRKQCLHAGFDYVDLELDEPDLQGKIAYIQDRGAKAVLSHHGPPDNGALARALETALETDADILKIIGASGGVRDIASQRKRYQMARGRLLIDFLMGAELKATRILSLVYGAPFTFAVPGPEPGVAPGQLTFGEIEEIYRPGSLTLEGLKLFGVIGSPIAHSQSPRFHNPRLREKYDNTLFLPFPASNAEDLDILLETFPELCGLSITSPMKEICFARANTFSSDGVRELGAINTLLLNRPGLKGANTDLLGIMEILEELEDSGPVRVVGYGGLGKAVVRACLLLGLPVEVCNRNESKLANLPRDAVKRAWPERHKPGPTILVQATSVGMAALKDKSPLDWIPHSVRFLVETIYHPRETRLIRMARDRAVRIVGGEDLFRKQARIQNQFFQKALHSFGSGSRVAGLKKE